MKQDTYYGIGTPGVAWGSEEKKAWLAQQTIKRSYQEEVLNKLDALKHKFDIEQYGELTYEVGNYPLFAVKTRHWDEHKPVVLVTGGVHGYETSGVQGAIRFLEAKAESYSKYFNIIVAPCVSPWGYETINRWNPEAIDPNRSFVQNSPAQEPRALMAYLSELGLKPIAHIDLHETTDTDNSEFRPALSARDGAEYEEWEIPDGFYLVGDTERLENAFQKAIIDSVEKVTHIAPADEQGRIIGEKVAQHGVIHYAVKKLGLCVGLSNSPYVTTTEVYPDSPNASDEICINAQVAAIIGGLDYILKK